MLQIPSKHLTPEIAQLIRNYKQASHAITDLSPSPPTMSLAFSCLAPIFRRQTSICEPQSNQKKCVLVFMFPPKEGLARGIFANLARTSRFPMARVARNSPLNPNRKRFAF